MIVPYLSDDVIFHRAEVFLDQYHPTRSLPIPIEMIAETKMNLFILPINKLESMCEIGGTISKDFKTILIDEKTYMNQEDRARFTIAHEIGHSILHKALFIKENEVYNVENFISFQNSLDNATYKRLEIQAFRFAEEVLCPKEKLLTYSNSTR